jgi:4-amino-4-deoxy-L-arabinose transferase-like glycosyltransferase
MEFVRLADAIFLLLLPIYIVAGTSVTPFHGDESTLIYMSRDYAYQFLQGDLDRVRYHDPPLSATEQELRLLNGTLPKYLIGLSWHLAGFSVDDLNEQWDWGADWNYNQSTGHAPSDALLQISRVPSALLLAAGVGFIFVIGRSLGGRPVAYLASLYYALNPALLLNGRRAMMEGSLTAFSLLALLAAIWLLREWRWWLALLLGVASGLALASKHSAAFAVATVFGACALYPLVDWLTKKIRITTRIYLKLLLGGLIALVVFYALNPSWWGDPLARLSEVLRLRTDLLAGQTVAFGGYASVSDALVGFFRQTFVVLPQYYEIPAWAGYIAEPIARYESSLWRGVSLGGSTIGGSILLILVVIGFWALLRNKTTSQAIRWLVVVWALAMFASTAALTPLEWQRYYLPVYPAVGLLAAYGIVWLARRISARYSAATALES